MICNSSRKDDRIVHFFSTEIFTKYAKTRRTAIIVGPYTPSFSDVMGKFLKRGAIIRLQKTEELADQAAVLFENPEIRKRMGFHAKTVVEECRGATAKYLDMIDELLPRQSVKSASTREN